MAQIVGQAPRKHRCNDELPPKRSWGRSPVGVSAGTLAECSCGLLHVWQFWGYSGTWGWAKYDGMGY